MRSAGARADYRLHARSLAVIRSGRRLIAELRNRKISTIKRELRLRSLRLRGVIGQAIERASREMSGMLSDGGGFALGSMYGETIRKNGEFFSERSDKEQTKEASPRHENQKNARVVGVMELSATGASDLCDVRERG